MKKESTKETLAFVKDIMSDEGYLDSVPNTIGNPLKLRWEESTFQYKVNKSGDRSGLYIDLNVAQKLKEEKGILIEAFKDLIEQYEYALRLIADAGGFTYSENNYVISNKKLLKNIEK